MTVDRQSEQVRQGTVEANTSSQEEIARLLPTEAGVTHYGGVDNDVEATTTEPSDNAGQSSMQIYTTISVMLVGVFLANIDASIILATYGKIASEFDDLDSGSWLISVFVLAQCVAQPLYGKMSDIYGRKATLQISYLLFGIGSAGTALGQTMGQLIAFRALQGAGSAGMTALVSIIITDLVPIHEVAAIRSYVNVLQATSRSFGGVIGGLLTQLMSWRWTFGIQVPILLIGSILVQWRLVLPERGSELSRTDKLKRVDFFGAFFLCTAILSLCAILETGGQKLPWASPIILTLIPVGVLSMVAFAISAHYVPEPILPLRVLAYYEVIANYIILMLQQIAQLGLMIIVPIVLQVTQNAGTAAAGAYLIPAFIGNLTGGLLTGYWIKRTGRYKLPTVISPIISIFGALLCLWTWNGYITIFEALFIFPGGLAMGIAASSTVVAAVAAVAEDDMAVTTSGSYLFGNLGAVGGTSIMPAVFQITLQKSLARRLEGVPDGDKILHRAISSIEYVQRASEDIRARIVPAFVDGFHAVLVTVIICATISWSVGVATKGHRLKTRA